MVLKDDNTEKKDIRRNSISYDKQFFERLKINDLSNPTRGRGTNRKYKQSEVREIIDGYKLKANQIKLVEISNLLWAKSPQYRNLLNLYSRMFHMSYVVMPSKDITKLEKDMVIEQYNEVTALLSVMNLKHQLRKVLEVAYREDMFYGYIHKGKDSFHIQPIDSTICKRTSIEDGIYNYSVNMTHFERNEDNLLMMPNEIKKKYNSWKMLKARTNKVSDWVELNPNNTICIKINENIPEIFPPFAGSFDSIFDIEGFKQLRKDKEELGNYMILTHKLPIRTDSNDNNDFMIEKDTMMFFHNQAVDAVPDNVGVITSPMEITPIKFDKDRADSDGVAKAERDFWSGNGTSQLLFNADKSTSEGLKMSIKVDNQMGYDAIVQIETWLNRYLKGIFSDIVFNVKLLNVTEYNQKEKFDMYLQAGERGLPVKHHIGATLGLEPTEIDNMSYLENDLLKMHEKFIPLQSSHTQGNDSGKGDGSEGAPEKDSSDKSDEGNRTKDKVN